MVSSMLFFFFKNVFVCLWCEELLSRQGPIPYNSPCLSFFQKISIEVDEMQS